MTQTLQTAELSQEKSFTTHTNPTAELPQGYTQVSSVFVDDTLKSFIEQEVLPGTTIEAEQFWTDFASLLDRFSHKNAQLLKTRDRLQEKIDAWHQERKDSAQNFDKNEYREFLQTIGYIAPKVGDFRIQTRRVDTEICRQAGPQLVVPVKNARFALNAANARWGSLYDALYGSDVISSENGAEVGNQYNPVRGRAVIDYARDFLDTAIALQEGSHRDVCDYCIQENGLAIILTDGRQTRLQDEAKFVGFRGDIKDPVALLFENNGLHIELKIDANGIIGSEDSAGIDDIVLESALTTIMDCEDSVAAVDAEDKIEVYRNWLGLMKGDLVCRFEKAAKAGAQLVERKLEADRQYSRADGSTFSLPGRSLLLVRNVGHLMTSPAILHADGKEACEGLMDAVLTSLIAMHDLRRNGRFTNSREASIYIVKPKMHGPEEVAFTDDLFSAVEDMLGLPFATIKLGIMDEERRTSLNLKACIKKAVHRTVFINTGFLDRTGDEIHTSMHAGAVVPKTQMKQQTWLNAYEEWNVDTGLDCGLPGKAQIGKGMWPKPDKMADMMQAKIAHPKAGANTAWVPSPTAATLHAIHYHKMDVSKQQRILENRINKDMPECFAKLLEIPLLEDVTSLTEEQIKAEIENNCQGILGYVVRWIDQGVGCSKVPDIHNVGLMEDRATLRISSQHIANWLLHGVCTKQQVEQALMRMAAIVDEQNAQDRLYQPMLPNTQSSLAFQAAYALIFKGTDQPNGYTEPLLHHYRRLKKAGN